MEPGLPAGQAARRAGVTADRAGGQRNDERTLGQWRKVSWLTERKGVHRGECESAGRAGKRGTPEATSECRARSTDRGSGPQGYCGLEGCTRGRRGIVTLRRADLGQPVVAPDNGSGRGGAGPGIQSESEAVGMQGGALGHLQGSTPEVLPSAPSGGVTLVRASQQARTSGSALARCRRWLGRWV